MVRDEITIEAEKRFAIEEAVEEATARALARGNAEGEAKGREEERIETARNFKKLGVPVATIAEATGLTVEQVESL